MKKILSLLIVCSFFITACGSDELEKFTEDYNKIAATEEITELNPENFGELEEEDGFMWRMLYLSDEYNIELEYEDEDNIHGFSIAIFPPEPYEDQEGKGYTASVSMAKALGVDSDEYISNFSTALGLDDHSYTENGLEVSFINLGRGSAVDSPMIIMFEKGE